VVRLGKIRGGILDHLDKAESPPTVDELYDTLHPDKPPEKRRPRDLRRRKNPETGKGRDGPLIMLEDAGILTVDGDVVTLADNWLERLEDARRLGGEVEADELAVTRLDIKRKGYHGRHRVKPDEHYANVGADGYIEDLEPVSSNNVMTSDTEEQILSPLAAAVRDYLERSPKDACEPVGWIGSTLWALDLFDGKPTPQDVQAAIEELGGESYLRERLEASRGAA
jgi:hypothetical protein